MVKEASLCKQRSYSQCFALLSNWRILPGSVICARSARIPFELKFSWVISSGKPSRFVEPCGHRYYNHSLRSCLDSIHFVHVSIHSLRSWLYPFTSFMGLPIHIHSFWMHSGKPSCYSQGSLFQSFLGFIHLGSWTNEDYIFIHMQNCFNVNCTTLPRPTARLSSRSFRSVYASLSA